MDLIIGGYSSGKFEYAKANYKGYQLYDENSWKAIDRTSGVMLYNLHLITKQLYSQGAEAEAVRKEIETLLELEHIVIICDEIGCGIVPMDKMERFWREETGRLLCFLAEKADRVIRMSCGIPQIIKG